MDAAAGLARPAESAGALVESASARLAAAGIATARLDAEVLLAEASGRDRTALYTGWRRELPTGCRTRFAALLTRRLAREPLQYIVGRQEFWSLDFMLTPAVLIPRPETELLIELASRLLTGTESGSPLPPEGTPNEPAVPTHIRHARNLLAGIQAGRKGGAMEGWTGRGDSTSPFPLLGKEGVHWPNRSVHQRQSESQGESSRGLRLCDLGSGSGCIAVALARELPRADIWALDISAAALAVAKTNARRHAVAERIHFFQSDLLAAVRAPRFDAIISNPPYVRSADLRRAQPELGWEPAQALEGGTSGLDVIERVVTQSYDCLKPDGWLIMEIGAGQGGAAERLGHAAGFSSVSVAPDYAGLPRALVARR